jgi:nitroreductase
VLSTDESGHLERLLQQRHSCRGFLPDPVPEHTIRRILELAQRTPSWCNVQPWQAIVTLQPATDRLREALYDHVGSSRHDSDVEYPKEYAGVYLQRRRECGFGLYESVGIARGDREASARQGLENFRFFGAPHVAIITTEAALGSYGVMDVGGWVTAFLLAATSVGVGTIAQAALASRSPFLRDYFSIPEGRQVVCGISFGFADTAHPANGFRTSRIPVDEAARFVRE